MYDVILYTPGMRQKGQTCLSCSLSWLKHIWLLMDFIFEREPVSLGIISFFKMLSFTIQTWVEMFCPINQMSLSSEMEEIIHFSTVRSSLGDSIVPHHETTASLWDLQFQLEEHFTFYQPHLLCLLQSKSMNSHEPKIIKSVHQKHTVDWTYIYTGKKHTFKRGGEQDRRSVSNHINRI